MSYILTNFMQLGSQESAGVFLMESNTNANTLEKAATESYGSDPEGVNFEIRVQYADQDFSDDWEVMLASYSLDAGDYKLTRVRTISSSAIGNASINFSSDTDSLRFYGVITHESVKPSDIRFLSKGVVNTSNNVTDVTSGTFVDACDRITITPKETNSRLVITFNGGVRAERDGDPAGTNFRCALGLSYKNSSNVDVDVKSRIIGLFSGFSDANQGIDAFAAVSVELTSSNLNASGNWEIAGRIRRVESDALATLVAGEFVYEEFVN